MSGEDEVERIRRIRDRQIQMRDPQIKQKKLQKNISRRRRSRLESFNLLRIFTDLPKVITSALVGLLFGLLVVLVLPYVITADWADMLAWGILVFTTLFGAVYGRALDARDSLSDF